ncbi:integral membrane protein PTH11 [Fusarium denticulatum]|uniref:Integral membrane protein PTH11 n=1 Tax=Fusarium denticulatum TaxID=48507 RepID=A0A8H6CWX8_9HYPO|nr:integral membrane protein PTH11 [Fusarium denticulatum]
MDDLMATMDGLITRRTVLRNHLAEIEDNIAIQEAAIRVAAGEDDVLANADTVDPAPSPRGDADNEDDNNNENDNNDIDDDLHIAYDFEGGFGGMMVPIVPEGPGSPETTSSSDVEIVTFTSTPSQPSKLSLRDTPSIVFWQGPRVDPRFKPDQWLSEKPSESFSRDFLQGIGTARLCNTLRPEIFVLMLAHPNAAGCPANEACHHWELRWDDRPRREPGTIELELICLDRRDRGDYIAPPDKEFHMLDQDHPNPIKCDPCFLFNALKPDFSSLDGTNLDVVLFRLLQPDDGEDDEPVEGRDESEDNNLDHPFEKIGWEEVHRYMDRWGRQLATLLDE